MKKYDLVIKNGLLFDSELKIIKNSDLAIKDNLIVSISSSIDTDDATEFIDISNKYVLPGLIDLHVHVWWGVAHLSVEVDKTSLGRGVPLVVDAGSSGSNTVDGFKRYVIDQSESKILAFLNISGMGQLDNDIGELEDIRWARVSEAVTAAKSHKDFIVGIKVRLSNHIAGANDLIALERSLEAAEHLEMPLMIHIGDTKHSLDSIIGKLRKGDVVTHSFHGRKKGIIDNNGKVIDVVRDARSRGVNFDVGHGAGSFSFDIAEKALEDGFPPDTISSDLHKYNINSPVFDLATTMSKYLHMGLSLEEVFSMSTISPARILNISENFGILKENTEANITVLKEEKGSFNFRDAMGGERLGTKRLVPDLLVWGGKIHPILPHRSKNY